MDAIHNLNALNNLKASDALNWALAPEDELDLLATMANKWGSEPLIEINVIQAKCQIAVGSRSGDLARWRGLIASEITNGRFNPFTDREWTQESMLAEFDKAREYSRVEDEPDTYENARWPLARSYVADMSDYRIWKIRRDVEEAGETALAVYLHSVAGSDDVRDHATPGQASRKRLVQIVDTICDGKR